MEKCLITKLPTEIPDDTLEVLGCLTLDVDAYEGAYTYIGMNPFVVKNKSGNVNLVGQNVTEGDRGKLYIEKYNLTSISILKGAVGNSVIALEQLKYCDYLTALGTSAAGLECNFMGDLSSLDGKQLTVFYLTKIASEKYHLTGDLSVFSNMPLQVIYLRGQKYVQGDISVFNIPTLKNLSIFGSKTVEGDIASIGDAINITSMVLYGNSFLTGSLDELFDKWAENGKTGNITVNLGGTRIKCSISGVIAYVNKTFKFENGSWSLIP